MQTSRVVDTPTEERRKWDSFYAQLPLASETDSARRFNREFTDLVQALLSDGAATLEAGCGAAQQSLALARLNRFQVEVADFSTEALKHARRAFGAAGLEFVSHVENVFETGQPRYDLVFNAGVLEHYTLSEQAKFLRGMASRSNRYVLALVPNRQCYWYWIWRIRGAKQGHWPFGKECPAVDLREAYQAAGLHYLGQTFLGRAWTEDLLDNVVGIDENLRDDLRGIHRSAIVEPAQACYLVAGLGSVIEEDKPVPAPWQTYAGTDGTRLNELTAALADLLALRLSADARIRQLESELRFATTGIHRLQNLTGNAVNSIAKAAAQAREQTVPRGSHREAGARFLLRVGRKAVTTGRDLWRWRTPPLGLDEVLQRAGSGKRPVVFLPSIPWSATLFQRPQHLARHFARRGHLTIYDCSSTSERIDGFQEIEPNLLLYKGPRRYLRRLPAPILWTLTYNIDFSRGYPANSTLVYDWIDDLTVFPFKREMLLRNHHRALADAHYVFAVARRLHEQLLVRRADAAYLPNAVDYEHFAAPAEPISDDPDLAGFLDDFRPVAGYYGAMAEWFDYDLLDLVARQRPDWRFLLIGPDYDGSLRDQPALRRSNVRWIGPRPYQVLPRYLRRFDVAMIPFKVNEITTATSPLKLYEYFAGGKPVVTTPMPECLAFSEVRTADTSEDFCLALDAALVDSRSASRQEQLRDLAQANSWAARVDQVLELLERSTAPASLPRAA